MVPQAFGELAAARVVLTASFGGDGEAGRDGHARAGHLRGAGALSTEKVAHFGGAFAELVDPLVSCHRTYFDGFQPPSPLPSPLRGGGDTLSGGWMTLGLRLQTR